MADKTRDREPDVSQQIKKFKLKPKKPAVLLLPVEDQEREVGRRRSSGSSSFNPPMLEHPPSPFPSVYSKRLSSAAGDDPLDHSSPSSRGSSFQSYSHSQLQQRPRDYPTPDPTPMMDIQDLGSKSSFKPSRSLSSPLTSISDSSPLLPSSYLSPHQTDHRTDGPYPYSPHHHQHSTSLGQANPPSTLNKVEEGEKDDKGVGCSSLPSDLVTAAGSSGGYYSLLSDDVQARLNSNDVTTTSKQQQASRQSTAAISSVVGLGMGAGAGGERTKSQSSSKSKKGSKSKTNDRQQRSASGTPVQWSASPMVAPHPHYIENGTTSNPTTATFPNRWAFSPPATTTMASPHQPQAIMINSMITTPSVPWGLPVQVPISSMPVSGMPISMPIVNSHSHNHSHSHQHYHYYHHPEMFNVGVGMVGEGEMQVDETGSEGRKERKRKAGDNEEDDDHGKPDGRNNTGSNTNKKSGKAGMFRLAEVKKKQVDENDEVDQLASSPPLMGDGTLKGASSKSSAHRKTSKPSTVAASEPRKPPAPRPKPKPTLIVNPNANTTTASSASSNPATTSGGKGDSGTKPVKRSYYDFSHLFGSKSRKSQKLDHSSSSPIRPPQASLEEDPSRNKNSQRDSNKNDDDNHGNRSSSPLSSIPSLPSPTIVSATTMTSPPPPAPVSVTNPSESPNPYLPQLQDEPSASPAVPSVKDANAMREEKSRRNGGGKNEETIEASGSTPTITTSDSKKSNPKQKTKQAKPTPALTAQRNTKAELGIEIKTVVAGKSKSAGFGIAQGMVDMGEESRPAAGVGKETASKSKGQMEINKGKAKEKVRHRAKMDVDEYGSDSSLSSLSSLGQKNTVTPIRTRDDDDVSLSSLSSLSDSDTSPKTLPSTSLVPNSDFDPDPNLPPLLAQPFTSKTINADNESDLDPSSLLAYEPINPSSADRSLPLLEYFQHLPCLYPPYWGNFPTCASCLEWKEEREKWSGSVFVGNKGKGKGKEKVKGTSKNDRSPNLSLSGLHQDCLFHEVRSFNFLGDDLIEGPMFNPFDQEDSLPEDTIAENEQATSYKKKSENKGKKNDDTWVGELIRVAKVRVGIAGISGGGKEAVRKELEVIKCCSSGIQNPTQAPLIASDADPNSDPNDPLTPYSSTSPIFWPKRSTAPDQGLFCSYCRVFVFGRFWVCKTCGKRACDRCVRVVSDGGVGVGRVCESWQKGLGGDTIQDNEGSLHKVEGMQPYTFCKVEELERIVAGLDGKRWRTSKSQAKGITGQHSKRSRPSARDIRQSQTRSRSSMRLKPPPVLPSTSTQDTRERDTDPVAAISNSFSKHPVDFTCSDIVNNDGQWGGRPRRLSGSLTEEVLDIDDEEVLIPNERTAASLSTSSKISSSPIEGEMEKLQNLSRLAGGGGTL